MVHPTEIKVLSSKAFSAAYLVLVPEFERATKHKVTTVWGGVNIIKSKMQGNQIVDVVIVAGDALDELTKQGKIVAGSRVDLARSAIGVAVRAGAPRPDISSVDALKRALCKAQSIACSTSVSGIYLESLFQRFGIFDQLHTKIKRVEGRPVWDAVVGGEAEIGFQQISELLPVSGIDYLGPLPQEIQKTTVFSAGVAACAKEPYAARALIKFLAAPSSVPVIKKSGMEPGG
jgi:molybdate transport system substrate-binding protein